MLSGLYLKASIPHHLVDCRTWWEAANVFVEARNFWVLSGPFPVTRWVGFLISLFLNRAKGPLPSCVRGHGEVSCSLLTVLRGPLSWGLMFGGTVLQDLNVKGVVWLREKRHSLEQPVLLDTSLLPRPLVITIWFLGYWWLGLSFFAHEIAF